MNADPLSARLTVLADDIAQIAKLVPEGTGRLGARLTFLAVRAALAAVAAQQQERETHSLRRALDEAHANALQEAESAEATARAVAAIEARHARSRTIAELMRPVLNGTANPDATA